MENPNQQTNALTLAPTHSNSIVLSDSAELLNSNQNNVPIINFTDELVFFIGNTRSGMSTTRLLLCCDDQNNFESLEVLGEPPCISDNNQDISDFGHFSCTSAPQFFILSKAGNTWFVDTPGRGDNRHFLREIDKLRSLNSVVNQVKKLKLLLFIPYKAFYVDASINELLSPILLASLYAKQLSNISAIGVVITMVDNFGSSADDKWVLQKVFSSFNKILQKSGLNPNDQFLVDLLEMIISNESVFLIRRPNLPVKLSITQNGESCNIIENEFNLYDNMCDKFVKFCSKLEYAERIGPILVTPSEKTVLVLITLYYPTILETIASMALTIVDILKRSIQQQILTIQTGKSMDLILKLSSARQVIKAHVFSDETAEQCRSVTLLINVAKVLNIPVDQKFFEKMKTDENNFLELQSCTGIKASKYPATDVLIKFCDDLEIILKDLDFTSIEAKSLDIRDRIQQKIDTQTKVLDNLYTQRFNIWCNMNWYGELGLEKVKEHLTTVRKLFAITDESKDVVTFFEELYNALDLVCTTSVKNELQSLSKKIASVGYQMDFVTIANYVVEALEAFEESWNNNLPDECQIKTWESDIVRFLKFVQTSILNHFFYADLKTHNLVEKFPKLLQFLGCVETYMAMHRVDQSEKQFKNCVMDFIDTINSSIVSLSSVKDFNYPENFNNIDNTCFPFWFKHVEALEAKLKVLCFWYETMLRLQGALKQLNVYEFETLNGNLCEYNDWEEKTERLLWPESSHEICLEVPDDAIAIFQDEKYIHEKEFCIQLVQSVFELYTVKAKNLLILLREKHIYISEVIETIKAWDNESELEDIFIISSENIVVDVNLVDKRGVIKNLILCGKSLKFSGYRKICLQSTTFALTDTIIDEQTKNKSQYIHKKDFVGQTTGNIFVLINEEVQQGSGNSLKLISKGKDSYLELENDEEKSRVLAEAATAIYDIKCKRLIKEFTQMLNTWHLLVGDKSNVGNLDKHCVLEPKDSKCAEKFKIRCQATKMLYELVKTFANTTDQELKMSCYCNAFVEYNLESDDLQCKNLYQNSNGAIKTIVPQCGIVKRLMEYENAIRPLASLSEFEADLKFLNSEFISEFIENETPTMKACLEIMVHVNARMDWLTSKVLGHKYYRNTWSRTDIDYEVNVLPERVKQLILDETKAKLLEHQHEKESFTEPEKSCGFQQCPGHLEVVFGDKFISDDIVSNQIFCFRKHGLPFECGEFSNIYKYS